MRKAVKAGLYGAILWLVADVIGIIVDMYRAINGGWFSYNVSTYLLGIIEWFAVASFILFILTFKKRIES